MIYMKIFVFPVFVCILENASENILRCLARRKMKKKKKHRNPLLSTNPPPQCTVNPPQTTIKKPQTQQTPQTQRTHKPPPRCEAQIGKAPVQESRESHRTAQPPRREAQIGKAPVQESQSPTVPLNRLVAKPSD